MQEQCYYEAKKTNYFYEAKHKNNYEAKKTNYFYEAKHKIIPKLITFMKPSIKTSFSIISYS